MVKHLFKMVWNRKRWNTLILIEIFLSFLVLFAIATVCLTLFFFQRNPIGFDYQDVWRLSMVAPQGSMDPANVESTFELFRQLENALKNEPEIGAFGLMNTPPYTGSNWSSGLKTETKEAFTRMSFVSEGIFDTLDLELSEGRWFREGDFVAQTVTPLVVNRRFAEALFDDASPIGKRVWDEEDGEKIEFEIVGVVEHFRKEGEMRKPQSFCFIPLVLREDIWLPNYALLEMPKLENPGYEEQLIKRLEGIAPKWSFKVNTMEQTRSTYLYHETRNAKVMALVAFFLLLMVAMGLIGVLWQHVTRRTVELGVRRAKGATRKHIHRQIMGEFLVIASIAVAMGLVFVVQIPFFGLFKNATLTVLVASFLTASLAIYLLTVLASLYPSWLATRIMPAEALHYE